MAKKKKTYNNRGFSENEWGLTQKQEDFAQSYAIWSNCSKAARDAKLGSNKDSSASIGWEYLRNPRIQTRINMLRKEAGKNFDLTKEKIMDKLMTMLDFDAMDMYDLITGKLLPPHKWPMSVRQTIAAIETKEDLLGFVTTHKIKPADKIRVMDMLNKMQGYYAAEKAPVGPDGKAIPQVNTTTIVINPVAPKPLDED